VKEKNFTKDSHKKNIGNSSVVNAYNNYLEVDFADNKNKGELVNKFYFNMSQSISRSQSVHNKMSDWKKSHHLFRMKNSPAIKKYQQCIEYAKLPLPNLIKG
jgi:hypothetical protein